MNHHQPHAKQQPLSLTADPDAIAVAQIRRKVAPPALAEFGVTMYRLFRQVRRLDEDTAYRCVLASIVELVDAWKEADQERAAIGVGPGRTAAVEEIGESIADAADAADGIDNGGHAPRPLAARRPSPPASASAPAPATPPAIINGIPPAARGVPADMHASTAMAILIRMVDAATIRADPTAGQALEEIAPPGETAAAAVRYADELVKRLLNPAAEAEAGAAKRQDGSDSGRRSPASVTPRRSSFGWNGAD